jgi:hypothetical protein
VIVLRPDPSDAFRFLCLARGAIIAGELADGQLFSRTLREDPGTVNFAASSALLVTVDRSGCVRGYRRTDFPGQYIFTHTAPPGAAPYVDSHRYYEIATDRLSCYAVSNKMLTIEKAVTITRVFESDTDVAFQVAGHPTLVRVGEETCFDVRQEPRELRLAGGCMCVWRSPEEVPTLFRISADPAPWLEQWRSGYRNAIAAVKAAAGRAAEEHRALANIASRFEADVGERLARLKNTTDTLCRGAAELEHALADRGIGSRTICLEEYARQREDACFRLAIRLPRDDFMVVCGEQRLVHAIEGGRVSKQTMIEVTAKLATLVDITAGEAVPLLVAVLVSFDARDPFVQGALKPIADQLLCATVDIFQTITPAAPIYQSLRKLSHIAVSFKTM